MNFIKYWKYFKYIVEHKKNVFIECGKGGLYTHAFTHDMSKFLPSEFIPYANFFYNTDRYNSYNKSDENNENFLWGGNHHQKRNKHHGNYGVSVTRKNEIVPVPMPEKYIKQMICDGKGMSRKFGGNGIDYYNKNKENFILHPQTENTIERIIYYYK